MSEVVNDANFYANVLNMFQHIKIKESTVNYIVNSSASLSHTVEAIEGIRFCSDKSDFSICSVTNNKFTIYFIDKDGNEIYSYANEKYNIKNNLA